MTEPLTPQHVDDIMLAGEVWIGGKFIGYARKVEIAFSIEDTAPISREEAKRLAEEMSAYYRKQRPNSA